MKKNNGQNGITLIALVVTIVVLLILAGITITYVLQDGGIFGTAQKAASETELAVIKDYASGGVIACYGNEYTPLADGETRKAAGEVMKDSFPAGAFAATPTVTVSSTGVTMAGTDVTVNGKVYTVTITNSAITVVAKSTPESGS